MINRKHLGLLLFVVVAVALTTSFAAFRGSSQQDPRSPTRQVLDKTLWPIAPYVAPAEADPEKAAKRKQKVRNSTSLSFAYIRMMCPRIPRSLML